ncbi:MAG: pseudouridine synthase, partial [Candidatus Taylorbacteria bacterium]
MKKFTPKSYSNRNNGKPFGARPYSRDQRNTPIQKTSHAHTSTPKKIIPAKVAGPSPIPKKDPNAFPMRINKYLAFKGYTTRRGADDMIAKRRLTINGRFAQLGDKVEETDAVEVKHHKKPEEYVYYAYNKPRGVSTDETRKGTKSIAQSISLRGVFAVGNLDTNADGLVILTNDKRIIDRLLGPHRQHDKEYIIRTITPLRSTFKERVEQGVV